jgi:hypothetical protein
MKRIPNAIPVSEIEASGTPSNTTFLRGDGSWATPSGGGGGGGGGLTAPVDAVDIADGSVNNTEFQYLNGVTSGIQTQLDGKATMAMVLAAQALRA